ncbi:electron transport complex subunit RsxG [Halomonas pacifica]|uniref:Ion-translocating oxidoreductase complex subunit G n=1 Tax=Bisbaumannia pacifica TaxID=77098 RepID=A0A510XB63_9GAMM|nr:electron transport complex subunit RsxG [Halomonas pacifica]MBH8578576.1 electron transport complex subunit RsxG [Halomonas pacifica]MDC8803832.1 electron transport complex subunit RsxG [Halomonas pacifica]GEK48686.1 electron transport complex subunit G [Halomonas pacifica]
MSLLPAIRRASLGLGLFALVTAGVVAGTRALTAERIAENQRAEEYRLLREVLPEGLRDLPVEAVLAGRLTLPASEAVGQRVPFSAWRVERDGRAALILPVVAQGYGGPIHLLVGIDRQGRLGGVRVTRHQETPGLGDPIERRKSDWILAFAGKSLTAPPRARWAVRPDGGDFDSFTGATITPRAVVTAVRRALDYVEAEGETLFTAPEEGP